MPASSRAREVRCYLWMTMLPPEVRVLAGTILGSTPSTCPGMLSYSVRRCGIPDVDPEVIAAALVDHGYLELVVPAPLLVPDPWYCAFWAPAFGPGDVRDDEPLSDVEWKLMLQTLHWNSVSPSGARGALLVLGDEAEVVLAGPRSGGRHRRRMVDVSAAGHEPGVRVVDDDHRVEPVDRA